MPGPFYCSDTQNRPVISSAPDKSDQLTDLGAAPNLPDGIPNLAGGPVSFVGNDLGQNIWRSYSSDVVQGGAGNDRIGMGAGYLQGIDGPQSVSGGAGDDMIFSFPGAGGTLKGDAGNDLLAAGIARAITWRTVPTAEYPNSADLSSYFNQSEIARMLASLEQVSFHAGIVDGSSFTSDGDGSWFPKDDAPQVVPTGDGTLGLDANMRYRSGNGHIDGAELHEGDGPQPIDFTYDAEQNILTVTAPQNTNIPEAQRQGPLQFKFSDNYAIESQPADPVNTPTLTLDGGDAPQVVPIGEGNDALIANDAGMGTTSRNLSSHVNGNAHIICINDNRNKSLNEPEWSVAA